MRLRVKEVLERIKNQTLADLKAPRWRTSLGLLNKSRFLTGSCYEGVGLFPDERQINDRILGYGRG